MNATGTLVEDATVRYSIDSSASKFLLQAFSTGLFSAFAHNPTIAIRDFQGDISFTLDNGVVKDAGLHLRIRPESLEVVDDISEKDRQEIQHRMLTEVLETDRFPEIAYECSGVTASGNADRYWLALKGDLSLHGVTHPLPVSARVVINGDALRASGECTVRQSDYDIAAVSAAGGTIKIKDELKFTFDIAGRKQS